MEIGAPKDCPRKEILGRRKRKQQHRHVAALINIAFLLCFRDVLNIIVFYCVFTRANTKIYAPRKENTGRRKGNQRLHKVSAKSGNVNISLNVWRSIGISAGEQGCCGAADPGLLRGCRARAT